MRPTDLQILMVLIPLAVLNKTIPNSKRVSNHYHNNSNSNSRSCKMIIIVGRNQFNNHLKSNRSSRLCRLWLLTNFLKGNSIRWEISLRKRYLKLYVQSSLNLIIPSQKASMRYPTSTSAPTAKPHRSLAVFTYFLQILKMSKKVLIVSYARNVSRIPSSPRPSHTITWLFNRNRPSPFMKTPRMP